MTNTKIRNIYINQRNNIVVKCLPKAYYAINLPLRGGFLGKLTPAC
jgi:hypothetical protein